MAIKGLLVAVAILLVAKNINAESNKKETEKTERDGNRVIVEIEISEKKIFYVDNTNIGFTRLGAKELCESLNMTLVRFETESKWLAVTKWLDTSPYDVESFWTGAFRDAGSVKWYWDHTGAEISKFYWAPNQPDMDVSKQACMSFKESLGGWVDNHCIDTLSSAFCEF